MTEIDGDIVVFLSLAGRGGALRRLEEAVEACAERENDVLVVVAEEREVTRLQKTWANSAKVAVKAVDLNWPIPGSAEFFLKSAQILYHQVLIRYQSATCIGFVGTSGLSGAMFGVLSSTISKMVGFVRGGEDRRIVIAAGEQGFIKTCLTKARVYLHKYIMTTYLGLCDEVAVQSPAGLSDVARVVAKASPGKATVLPNNVNPSWTDSDLTSVDHQVRSVSPKFRLVFVGRITYQVKGIDVLLEACRRLDGDYYELWMIGDGTDSDQLKHDLNCLALGTRYFGWVENPFKLMAKGDVVVVPSRYDPFPNTILEAAAVGVPVLASRVDGIPYMLPGENLFMPGDADEIVEKVESCTADRSFFMQVKRNTARCREKLDFSWKDSFCNAIVEDRESDTEPAVCEYLKQSGDTTTYSLTSDPGVLECEDCVRGTSRRGGDTSV